MSFFFYNNIDKKTFEKVFFSAQNSINTHIIVIIVGTICMFSCFDSSLSNGNIYNIIQFCG